MFGEWYKNAPSKIELTLRFPYLLLFAFILFLTRPLLKWFLVGFLIWLLTKNNLIAIILGFVLALVWEMISLYGHFKRSVLPRHLKNLEGIEKMSDLSNKESASNLIKNIEKTTKLSTWGLINIVYIAIPSWGHEIIFKLVSPLLIRPPRPPYYDLLIGFPNKNTEADQLLWEVANNKDSKKTEILLNRYLHDFGGRIGDIDLGKPTLREQPNAIQTLLKLYKNTSSPQERRRASEDKRERAIEQAVKQLRVSKKIFLKFLSVVQKNVNLREDRRHYEFLSDYYLRQMLIELGNRIGINQKEIFNKSWGEIKHEAASKNN